MAAFAPDVDALAAAAEPVGAPAEARPIAGRWYTLAILTLLVLFHHIDRNLVSILAEPIKREFHLSDSQVGLITGLSFALAYVAAGIPMGMLADRVRRVPLAASLLALWSVLTFMSGLARSATYLLAARVGVAAAEAGAMPTSMSLLSDYFPRRMRATALGIFYASTPLGLAIGFALGGLVAAHYGWRAAFFVAGVPGLLLAAVVILTLREPQRGAADGERPNVIDKPSFGTVLRLLWARRAMLYLVFGVASVIVGQAGITAFIAPFLIRVHHVSLASAGLLAAASIGLGGLIGMPAGGVLADRLVRRGVHRVPQFVAITMLLACPCAVAGLLAPSTSVAVSLIALYALLNSCYYGASFSAYLGLAPAALRGSASAVMITLGNLVGYALGPQLSGLFSDAFAAAGFADSIRWSLIVLTSFYVLGAIFFFAASRRIRSDVDRPLPFA